MAVQAETLFQSRFAADRSDLLRDTLQWDIQTWAAGPEMWQRFLNELPAGRVLDIGARDGGLSLYCALLGHNVVCSDIRGPSDQARQLHQQYAVEERISYAAIDATRIAFPDNSFDVVCFKSVLGGVGHGGRLDRQMQAVTEMHRVLRPGGLLLFAENLTGSRLHRYFRRRFVKWAREWRYVSLHEVAELFASFKSCETECHGVIAAFGRTERQRLLLHTVDKLVEPLLPDRCKYMLAGVAIK